MINVFNFGKHKRDFTYIDDIVEGVIRVLDKPASSDQNWNSANPDPATSSAPYRLYNIGNNNPIILMDYIDALESSLGKVEIKDFFQYNQGTFQTHMLM